jgi:membrane-bound lytic murein transglycosylase D
MLSIHLLLSVYLSAAPASQPSPSLDEDDREVAEAAAADGADDDAIDDEAAELWKLQELEQQAGGALVIPTDDWLPADDIDMAKRAVVRERRTHPEDVVVLLEHDPATLFGQRLAAPSVAAMWPMFVEYDGKSGLFDPKDYDIPLTMHPMVEQWMKFFTGSGREYFNRWLARSTRYVPVFREILKQHNLPQDTVYLSMIESGFHVRAFSRAKAAGPWQFMSYTGKRFGLKIDPWVDERRDWVKATHAAADYLKELYGQFGNWYLAWAGYNAGGGKMSRAVAKYNSKDFFELVKGRYLHPETKNYVPKLIAAAIIAKSPRRYGFTEVEWQKPFDYDTVEVEGGTDLRYAAKALDIETDTLFEMNSALKYGITPPGQKWLVRVPRTDKATFLAKLNELLPKTKPSFRVHVARRGEALTGIAAAYGSSVEAIREQNRLSADVRLMRGQELLIPIIAGMTPKAAPKAESVVSAARVAQVPAPVTERQASKDGRYTVQPGDSLWSISQSFGCTVADLKKANGISNHRGLQAGQNIKIP